MSDGLVCPRCGLEDIPEEEMCWSELEQRNICFECYCEVEEN